MTFGFDELGLDEIVSFTTADNRRSRRVMERLGMTHAAGETFDHPRLSPGHPLRRHVLYRLRASARGAEPKASCAQQANDVGDSRSSGGMTSSGAK